MICVILRNPHVIQTRIKESLALSSNESFNIISESQYTITYVSPFIGRDTLRHAYVLMQICVCESLNSWQAAATANAAPFRKLKWYRVRLFFAAFNRNTRSVYPRVRSPLDKKRNWRVQTARKYCSVSARENLLLWSATRGGESEPAKQRKALCPLFFFLPNVM